MDTHNLARRDYGLGLQPDTRTLKEKAKAFGMFWVRFIGGFLIVMVGIIAFLLPLAFLLTLLGIGSESSSLDGASQVIGFFIVLFSYIGFFSLLLEAVERFHKHS